MAKVEVDLPGYIEGLYEIKTKKTLIQNATEETRSAQTRSRYVNRLSVTCENIKADYCNSCGCYVVFGNADFFVTAFPFPLSV